jgi:short-subunit dehydrogenase
MSIEGAGGMHIIITGASSGIGEAIARQLASEGHRLVLAARRTDKLEALARDLNPSGKRVIVATTDLTKPGDLETLVARARGVFGAVSAVINNAGISGTIEGKPGKWWLEAPEPHRALLETNLLAAIELTRLVLPEMIENRAGAIVNIGSVAGRIASSSLYSASKFGLRGFSLSLRRELLGTGVTSSLIAPGYIKTEMTTGVTLPMPGPEIVAKAVSNVLQRPKAEVIVPGWYRALIWLETLSPALGDRLLSTK